VHCVLGSLLSSGFGRYIGLVIPWKQKMPEFCETGTPFAMSGLRCFGSMNTTTTRAFDVSDTGRDRYVSWR